MINFVSRARLMIVAMAVLALLAASCSSSGDTTDTANTAAATDVTFESAGDPNAIVALPTLDRSETDPAVGMAAPRIEGTGYDGETIVLGAEGAPQVIAFLAHWCPHCQDEMPVVNDWIASGAVPAGVEVVGVATSISPDRDNYPPEDWFAADGPLLPGLPDPDNTIAANYGMPGFPYWVAVNADGTVAARAAGNLSVDVMQQLADMVANSTPPT